MALDDKSHRSASAQKRDADQDRALAAAKSYEPVTLRDQLAVGLAAG